MIKTVLKEICIMSLLCVAIVLLFGIVFYDYIPMSKVVPNKVSYSVPNDVKSELETEVVAESTTPVTITYSVTASDLSQYKSEQVYQPGNPNPFQPYSIGNNNSVIVNGTGDETSTGTKINNNSADTPYYQSNGSTK